MIIEDQKFTPYKDGLAVIPHKEETTSVSTDEMFEKLGYENGTGHNLGDGEKYIYYDGHYNRILFYKKSKKININGSFTMQELQAINEKCKELGWI